MGRIDIRDDKTVLDIKTAKSKPANGQPSGDWRLKGSIYSRITGYGMGWHVVSKAQTVGVYTPQTDAGLMMAATPALAAIAERRIVSTAENLVSLYNRYGPDEPWPTTAPEHIFLCRLCSFQRDCGWWQA